MHDTERDKFEAFISSPPFERSVERWPDDERHYAWYGQYKDSGVALAWEVWKSRADLAGKRERRLAGALERARATISTFPKSMGYDLTDLRGIDEILAEHKEQSDD